MLKKVDIKIDVAVECSIGSLVGVAYAYDRLSALEDWVTSFSYWDVLCLMDLSRQHGGSLRDERVFNQYREIMPETEIENYPRCLAAVTADLGTRCELWFIEDDLHPAIRASYSIPGLMASAAHNGYWLVDRVVANPIPISLTCALGADTVIMVDLQHDVRLAQQDLLSLGVSEENSESDDSLPRRACPKKGLDSITTRRIVTASAATEVMATSIQVLENRPKRNRMTGDPPDILTQPVCPQMSTFDSHRAHAVIAVGQLAVEKKMDELLPSVRTNTWSEFLSTLKLILTDAGGDSTPLLSKASQGEERDTAIDRKTDPHC